VLAPLAELHTIAASRGERYPKEGVGKNHLVCFLLLDSVETGIDAAVAPVLNV
jgi:hypothetical protein